MGLDEGDDGSSEEDDSEEDDSDASELPEVSWPRLASCLFTQYNSGEIDVPCLFGILWRCQHAMIIFKCGV